MICFESVPHPKQSFGLGRVGLFVHFKEITVTVLVSTCHYPVFYIVILYGEINRFGSRHWVRSTKKFNLIKNVNVNKNIVAVQRVTRKLL